TLGAMGQFHASGLDPTDYSSQTSWNPQINLKTTGIRSLVVGSGWTGTKAGDTLTDPGAIWLSGTQAPFISADVSGEGAGPIVSIEIIAHQELWGRTFDCAFQ